MNTLEVCIVSTSMKKTPQQTTKRTVTKMLIGKKKKTIKIMFCSTQLLVSRGK